MESEECSCSYLRRIPRERIYKVQEIRPAKRCCEGLRSAASSNFCIKWPECNLEEGIEDLLSTTPSLLNRWWMASRRAACRYCFRTWQPPFFANCRTTCEQPDVA